MNQFKLNIDLEELKKQQIALARVAGVLSYSKLHSDAGAVEGVLSILGAIRDQIDPPKSVYPDELKPPPRPMTDRLALLICEGAEDPESDEEFTGAWQRLVDTRIAWSVRGSFGRIADRLIKEGVCKPPPEKSRIIKLPNWMKN